MTRAGFFIRAAACLLDLVFCVVPAITLFYGSFLLLLRRGTQTELAQYYTRLLFLGCVLVYWASETVFAQSPGKRLLRLVIVRANGTEADGWTLLSRYLTKFCPWILHAIAVLTFEPGPLVFLAGWMQLIILLGCLAVLGESKRAFHDRWSGTAVCRMPPQSRPHGFDVLPPPPPSPSA